MEKQELSDKFQRFYMNKMLYYRQKKTFKEPSHIPTLNPVSIVLAEKSRERKKQIMQTARNVGENKATITELLLALGKSTKVQEDEEVKELNTSRLTRNHFGKDKCASLYKLSRTLRRQFDKTTEEVEYEKAKNELTFSPRISKFVV
eukprot:TRINITY_DN11666_c0_g2_i1.p1 TRINITY_DN11666_c0_g2~~TRINITY_DN11666_c0_g2_i1.p1  ORF type:complete len:147 (+),score=39.18 TRINITY_DN11666_c0_g2_i1:42-482(+)